MNIALNFELLRINYLGVKCNNRMYTENNGIL